MKHWLALLLCTLTACCHAQQTATWQELLEQWMPLGTADEEAPAGMTDILAERAMEPIELNHATRQDLEELPFLSAQQVEDIMAYLYQYGPMRSPAELQMIPSIDWDTRLLLLQFVTIDEGQTGGQDKLPWPRLPDMAAQARQQVMLSAKVPLYKRKGDHNGYLGYPYRHDLRYQLNWHNRLRFGITAAQDSGEPFFTNGNKEGYDHYAFYLQLRDMGRLEEFNAGMFRPHMGMGLILNGTLLLGKQATWQALNRSTHALTALSSRSETNYMQGIGATIRIARHWHVTAFASLRPLDATLNADGSARTIVVTGYHRTPAEMEHKHNTRRTDFGGSIGYRKGSFSAHLNTVATHLSRRLAPQKAHAAYRQYAAEGSDFSNISADYAYTCYRLTVAGETAIDRHGAMAALHTASLRLNETLSLTAIHRYYDKRYTALHARSFGEGSGVQNEHGIYAGLSWQPRRTLRLQWYADYAHFAWPRYQVSAPSDAFDTMLTATVQWGKWDFDTRYRLHLRQHDNATKTYTENRPEQRIRLRAAVSPSATLRLQTMADAVMADNGERTSKGIMLGQQAAWQHRWLRVDGQAGWFCTDDYASRLYQYERSVLNDFSFPMYYGHGMRLALMARAETARLLFTAKVGCTHYFDRQSTGSGLQQTDGHTLTDVLLQLRVKW